MNDNKKKDNFFLSDFRILYCVKNCNIDEELLNFVDDLFNEKRTILMKSV